MAQSILIMLHREEGEHDGHPAGGPADHAHGRLVRTARLQGCRSRAREPAAAREPTETGASMSRCGIASCSLTVRKMHCLSRRLCSQIDASRGSLLYAKEVKAQRFGEAH